jgi:nitrite reductase (NADH) small subunit
MNTQTMIRDSVEISLGSIEQIPIGEGREFTVAMKSIAVFRSRNGRIYATDAACPHRGGPLADGIVGGSTVICPLHGWKFDLETGAPRLGECSLTTYPARVASTGELWVSLG